MHSPARRVSEVSELIALICDFAEKSSLVKLLTVSQRFFYCVAPLIWKEVPGVANLLALLPRLDTDLDLKEFLVVGPDDLRPCDQSQLARFITYAPFVQKLESNAKTDGDNLGWDLLLSRVPTRPLLPNLRALAIKPDFIQSSTRFIEYIDAFLCPTLSGIYTSSDWNLWMDPLEGGALLVRMAAACPNLNKLNMLIGSSRHSVDLRSSGVYSTANFFTPISQFRDLRFLRSSSAVVNARVLQLLGNLPRLESLAACSPCVDGDDDEDDLIPIANLVLPERSFPSLRNLEIDCVPGTVLSKLWQTSPLVRNLVSVRVQFMAHNTESPSDLVCMICQGSPHITDLDLDLNRVGDTALSNVAVEHLRRLPLLRLRIWEAQVDVRSLVLALPNVEYLTLNSMLVNFEDLALIAKHMPKLQYLCTGLALWGWPMYFELPGDSWSPSPCHLDSRFPFEEFFNIHSPDYNEEIDEIAQGLHMLWPKGIHCGFGFWDDQGDTDYGTLERINNTTKALSASSALHIPTPEEASSRWVYESW